jgi:hypothetical protein
MSKQWYFQAMGVEIGPISPAELMDKVKCGQVQADTLVRSGPDGKWLPADRVKGLLPKPETPPLQFQSPSPRTPIAPTTVVTAANRSPVAPTAANEGEDEDEDETIYHFSGEAVAVPQTAAPESETFEFFEFVGFRHAITPALYDVLVAHANKHRQSITQVTRQALATFLGRPELGVDKTSETATDAGNRAESQNSPEDR